MGAYKTSLPWWKIVLLGAVAGCYVGLGGALLLTGEAGAAARVERPRASKRRPTLFRRLSHPRPPRPTRLCPSPVGPNCPGIASSNPGLAKYITGAIGFPFALLQILVRVCMGSCACARVGVSVQAPTLCTRTPSPPPHTHHRQDNLIHGRFLAELTREFFNDLEASKCAGGMWGGGAGGGGGVGVCGWGG